MIERIVVAILGSGLAEKFLRAKVAYVAAGLVTWVVSMVGANAFDASEATKTAIYILDGVLTIALMAFHAWTDRAAIQAGLAGPKQPTLTARPTIPDPPPDRF